METNFLQNKLMEKYCQGEFDKEIISALCYAPDAAEKVACYFSMTNNKTEFYRSILNDRTLYGTIAYQTLYKYYKYLKEE